MFLRLGNIVSRYWWLTILIWLGIVAGLRLVAPSWDDITRDGDLEFLPTEMPSAIGERLKLAAFPENRANSQIVLIFSRDREPLMLADLKTSDRFASRFHNHLAVRLASLDDTLASSLEQLDEALQLDPENAEAFHNRAIVRSRMGQQDEAQVDRELEKLKLYHIWFSPYSLRVRRVLRELRLGKVGLRDTRQNRDFARELARQGGKFQVPCLRIEKEDGSVEWMYESLVIARYLRERFGTSSKQ